MKTWVRVVVLSLFIGAIAVGALSNQAAVKITFPIEVSPQNIRTLTVDEFAKAVSARSDGRIEVTVYPGSQLYNADEGLRALTEGSVQMMVPSSGHFAAYAPMSKAIEIPFVFKDRFSFDSFLYGPLGARILDALAKANIKGITYWDEGPIIIATKDRVLKSPEDYKGLKIRTSGHIIVEQALHALGASTVRLSFSEVYSAAQQGVINGVFTTLEALVSSHLYEVLPYVTLWPGHAGFFFVASKAWWDQLSDDDRFILDSTAKQMAYKFDYLVYAKKSEFAKTIEDKGGTYYEPTSEEVDSMRKVIAPLYDQWRQELGDIVDSILVLAKY